MPYITLSSGLTIKVPTRGTRNWADELLNNTFKKISEHDHTGSGKGLPIGTNALSSGAVTINKIAAAAMDGDVTTDLATVGQVQNSQFLWGGTTGGTANAQTATLTPAPASLVAGATYRVKIGPGLTNTSASPTINFNGLGAKTIKYIDGRGVLARQLNANHVYELLYDGTDFLLLNPSATWSSYTATITPATGSFTGTVQDCEYTILNGTVGVVNTRFTGTKSGGAAAFIDITLPDTAFNTLPGQYRVTQVVVASTPRLSYVTRATTSVQRYSLVKDTESDVTENWPDGAVITITDSFTYRLA